jgi:tRNA (guanine-N7-)-methyltransferase
MKPEDLKSPFTWDERHVVISDRIWYVPDQCSTYADFTFPGWNHPDLFGNPNPVKVEYCSGNGAWIADKAERDPSTNWVAIERKFERVRKIWSKVKNRNLSNLLIICGEGYNITTRYFLPDSVNEIFINFPDPWPKKRHAKNRIIQMPFVSEMLRTLKPRGSITFVTDDSDFSEWTIKMVLQDPGFVSSYPEPYYVTDHPEYGTSYFEQLWRDKGKIIRYHQFCKT